MMREQRVTTKVPRRASTVLLTRPSGKGFEIYLMRRSAKSSFMPGSYVFPGGNLDQTDWDRAFWMEHSDMDLKDVVRNLGGGLTEEEVLAHSVAAIRETFEEAGVLLTVQSGRSSHALEEIRRLRLTKALEKGWFREVVEKEEMIPAFSCLGRWSHWITPETRSHRFDARFFMAFLPPGQECVPDNLETTHGIWVSPEDGLGGNLKGDIPLSPPALVTLHELLAYQSMGELKGETEHHPWGEPRLSSFRRFPEGQLILLPPDPHFGEEDNIDPSGLKKRGLGPGEPFTRLWCQDGVWRPIAS